MGNYGTRILIGENGQYDRAGHAVSGIGDVNGDGIEDFAVTARYGDNDYGVGTGAVYVVYGTDDAELQLNLSDLDGTNGYKITADTEMFDYIGNTTFGDQIVALGDVNDDGYDDFAIVQNGTNESFGYTEYGYYNEALVNGVAYVIYGNQIPVDGADAPLASVAVDDMDHARFDVDGEIINMQSQDDLNGDGIADFSITTKSRNTYDSGYVANTYIYDANGNGYYDYGPDNPNEFANYYGGYVEVNDITGYIVYGTDADRTDFDPVANEGGSSVIVDVEDVVANGDGFTINLGQTLRNNYFFEGGGGEFEVASFSSDGIGDGGGYNYDYYGDDNGAILGSADLNGDGFVDLVTQSGGVYIERNPPDQ